MSQMSVDAFDEPTYKIMQFISKLMSQLFDSLSTL